MNARFLILITSLISLLTSCQNFDFEKYNNSIRPVVGVSEKQYTSGDFTDAQISNHEILMEMNHSNFDFAVKIDSGKLIIAEPTFDHQFFELKDGKLEIINKGEFGGALNFIPNKNISDTISILEVPINFVFNFKEKIYFVVGIPHIMDSGGAIFELSREGDKFAYKEVVRLDSAPQAIAIHENKILIAGHQMFTVIENFKKENIIENAFWHGLYPTSIAVKNDQEVYIGMRGGYSKLSLISKKATYYKYRKNKNYMNK